MSEIVSCWTTGFEVKKDIRLMTPNRTGSWLGTILLIAVTLLSASSLWAADKYKIPYNFTGGADGSGPTASPIFDHAGNLYGTTQTGGSTDNCSRGCGVVFKLTPNSSGKWTESVLYSFCSLSK